MPQNESEWKPLSLSVPSQEFAMALLSLGFGLGLGMVVVSVFSKRLTWFGRRVGGFFLCFWYLLIFHTPHMVKQPVVSSWGCASMCFSWPWRHRSPAWTLAPRKGTSSSWFTKPLFWVPNWSPNLGWNYLKSHSLQFWHVFGFVWDVFWAFRLNSIHLDVG